MTIVHSLFRYKGLADTIQKYGVALREIMTQKSESSFEEDDFVVYPTHGVGRILGTEKREVAGITLEMLVVGLNMTA